MRKYLLGFISMILLLTACSSVAKKDSSKLEQETTNKKPTVEERDKFLQSNEFIVEFNHSKDDDSGTDTLTITLNDQFFEKKISEQYLYLVDFYEELTKNYGDLYDFFGSINVFCGDTEFPTYMIFKRSFTMVSANVAIDREVGQRPEKKILDLIDTLDKHQVLSGTDRGLTLAEKEAGAEPTVKQTLITTSGEVKGALRTAYLAENPEVSSNNGKNDTETSIKGMSGSDWVKLTENQKFHAVSNALYSLAQGGYTINENEDFYIKALDAFYTDSSSMDMPVNEALAQIGIMSKTITK
ncbi:hypothetical protein [Neobacillus niacini]|uniref:hypothetical protein n=1 Tax=Neobacillus niacini TaxID=86668 RepID=UPI0021CB1D82|nr:hypothetical protein [Neobacillus niacini]MCM3763906.1 hypothetical protein [Neobacillus niacini]